MICSSMTLPGVLIIGFLLNKIGTLDTITWITCIMFLIGTSASFLIPNLRKGES